MKEKYRNMVDAHQDKVYTLAVRILSNRTEAEDVSQEVYLKLWQSIEQIESDRAHHWLLRVTRNACLDRLRQKRLASEAQINCVERFDDVDEPAQIIAYEQLGSWLRSAIEKLREPYRSLIVLCDIHQHSHRQAAETLSINENQVKVYLHRGRLKLREILREVEL